jgi:hypothetical protein
MSSALCTPCVAGVSGVTRVGEDERFATVSCVVWAESDDGVVCVLELVWFFFFFRPRLFFFALWGPGIWEVERKRGDCLLFTFTFKLTATVAFVLPNSWTRPLHASCHVAKLIALFVLYYSTLYHWCLDVGYNLVGGSRTQSDSSSVQVLCPRAPVKKGNSCQKWA